jgi:PIN domain nuclease of toxin-antitoxin system
LILLDASALVAFLYGEPAAGEVAALLRSGECATPAPCLAELVDQLIRRNGVQPDDVADHLGLLIEASLGVLAIENEIAWQAGELRAVHYRRSNADLSLADCLLLAAAGLDDEIATSDPAVIATARTLNLTVIPLPDSNGNRPAV